MADVKEVPKLKDLPAFRDAADRAQFARSADLDDYNLNSEVGREVLADWLASTRGRKPIPHFETDEDAERFVAEADLTEYDLSGGRSLIEALPEIVKRGRPKSDDPKRMVSIRLDADVLERLRADGDGWQTRINAILRKELGI